MDFQGITPLARDWIARNAAVRESRFLHVHVWDPHTPYTAEPRAVEVLGEQRPDRITTKVLDAHRAMAGPHSARETLGFDCPGRDSWSFP